MRKSITILFVILVVSIAGCNSFGTSNLPAPAKLTKLKPKLIVASQWSADVNSGESDSHLNLKPTVIGKLVYTSDVKGHVTATKASNGVQVWQTDLDQALTTGPAVGNGLVVVGSQDSHLIALNQKTGKLIWRKLISNQITAAPAIKNDIIVYKTIDDNVGAVNAKTGQALWQASHDEPSLILQGDASPVIANDMVIVGYADGAIAALKLQTGQIVWQQQVALPRGTFPVQRLVDIDATPVVKGQVVYVVSYNGAVAALSLATGAKLWSRQLSSYVGLAVGSHYVYITDSHSQVWALDKTTGQVAWYQNRLKNRLLTAPLIAKRGVVVADRYGYVHWLDKNDGQLIARVNADGTIKAAPIQTGKTILVSLTNGELISYQSQRLS